MAGASDSPHSVGHPGPHRERVSRLHMAFALFGAPAAWVAQMAASEIVSSYNCYPHRVPLAEPLVNGTNLALAAISILCIACAAGSIAASWAAWRRSRHEAPGQEHHVIDTGEGATRFLAMLALLSGSLFTIATLFTFSAYMVVPLCGK